MTFSTATTFASKSSSIKLHMPFLCNLHITIYEIYYREERINSLSSLGHGEPS
jgi:hypothetical protein